MVAKFLFVELQYASNFVLFNVCHMNMTAKPASRRQGYGLDDYCRLSFAVGFSQRT